MPIKIKLTREPYDVLDKSPRYPRGTAKVRADVLTEGTDLGGDLGTVLCHDWADQLGIPVDSSLEVLLYLGEGRYDVPPKAFADRTILLSHEWRWITDEDGDEHNLQVLVVEFPGADYGEEEVVEDFYAALEVVVEAGLGGQVQLVFPVGHKLIRPPRPTPVVD